jgi:hypothetical protein
MMKSNWIGAWSFIHEGHPDEMNLETGSKEFLYSILKYFLRLTPILIIMASAFSMAEADEAEYAELHEGDLITYYYNVSNIGNVNLTEVVVVDDKVDPVYVSGDENNDSWLNLSEVWLYKAIYKVTAIDLKRDLVNIANVTAKDPCGKPVDDDDIEVVRTAVVNGEPIQYSQFCEAQKISGSGFIDMNTAIRDKKIALDYSNIMNGDGDIELDQEQAYSENADKLKRKINSVNGGNESTLNLYESTNLVYSGETPLQGEKHLHSRAFEGGMGSELREVFSVQQMEAKEVSFFVQTMPYEPSHGWRGFQEGIADVGRDTKKMDELMRSKENVSNPSRLMGLENANAFNGTWGTESIWNKIFYKKINSREMFSGTFEAEKLIKFHQYPLEEETEERCKGIDC